MRIALLLALVTFGAAFGQEPKPEPKVEPKPASVAPVTPATVQTLVPSFTTRADGLVEVQVVIPAELVGQLKSMAAQARSFSGSQTVPASNPVTVTEASHPIIATVGGPTVQNCPNGRCPAPTYAQPMYAGSPTYSTCQPSYASQGCYQRYSGGGCCLFRWFSCR